MSRPFSVADHIQAHTLANSIISGHNTADAVLDPSELALLRQFCIDRSASKRDAILSERDMVDEQGTRPGEKAAKSKGSLAGFLIARYGTSEPGLEEGEWEMLREWFGSGVDISHA
ncbi:hypothetical protein W97_01059 [Coniosporium apollinis CBS 100218]|uniref:Uncharacterized protein n=1 Tax=Coniosporium apollinis (strain CBS 100218) TaxID=1168221 RepID=R7YJL3_CONA1|nr:uncharacterized protein W97_01059 [Coniosporium apollinis CBS 100218]EON61841.1 hypothetical protein W97_01059 [Coniosporium apollinis CBS 100218]